MIENRVLIFIALVLCLSAPSLAHAKKSAPAPQKPVLSPVYTANAWAMKQVNASYSTRFSYQIFSDYSNTADKKLPIDSIYYTAFDQYALNDHVYQDYPQFSLCKIYKVKWGSGWNSLENATFGGSYEYERGHFCNIWDFFSAEGNPSSFCCAGNTPIFTTETVKDQTGTLHIPYYNPSIEDESVFVPPSYCKPVSGVYDVSEVLALSQSLFLK